MHKSSQEHSFHFGSYPSRKHGVKVCSSNESTYSSLCASPGVGVVAGSKRFTQIPIQSSTNNTMSREWCTVLGPADHGNEYVKGKKSSGERFPISHANRALHGKEYLVFGNIAGRWKWKECYRLVLTTHTRWTRRTPIIYLRVESIYGGRWRMKIAYLQGGCALDLASPAHQGRPAVEVWCLTKKFGGMDKTR